MGTLWESGDTFRPLLRKLYLNAYRGTSYAQMQFSERYKISYVQYCNGVAAL